MSSSFPVIATLVIEVLLGVERMLLALLAHVIAETGILQALESVLKVGCDLIIRANHPNTLLTKACVEIKVILGQIDADRAAAEVKASGRDYAQVYRLTRADIEAGMGREER